MKLIISDRVGMGARNFKSPRTCSNFKSSPAAVVIQIPYHNRGAIRVGRQNLPMVGVVRRGHGAPNTC